MCDKFFSHFCCKDHIFVCEADDDTIHEYHLRKKSRGFFEKVRCRCCEPVMPEAHTPETRGFFLAFCQRGAGIKQRGAAPRIRALGKALHLWSTIIESKDNTHAPAVALCATETGVHVLAKACIHTKLQDVFADVIM